MSDTDIINTAQQDFNCISKKKTNIKPCLIYCYNSSAYTDRPDN